MDKIKILNEKYHANSLQKNICTLKNDYTSIDVLAIKDANWQTIVSLDLTCLTAKQKEWIIYPYSRLLLFLFLKGTGPCAFSNRMFLPIVLCLTGRPVPFLLWLKLFCRLVSNMQSVTVNKSIVHGGTSCILNFELGLTDYA